MNDVKKRGFSSKEAAVYLGISESALRQSRMDGPREGRLPPPPYVRLGRKIVYLKDEMDQWIDRLRGKQK